MVLSACSDGDSAGGTVPRNKGDGVDARTIVAVRFSDVFSDADTGNTDPEMIVVTGDLTADPYTGTIVFADWSDIRSDMTVEEFETEGLGSSSPTSPSATPTEEDDPPPTAGSGLVNNALVFLLPSDESFKAGETISVFVSHDVTTRGRPIEESKEFAFRVSRRGAQTEPLEVSSTDPLQGALDVEARPRVSVRFTRAVTPDGLLSGGIVLRAAQSGAHVPGQTLFTDAESATAILEAAVRLGADDAFLPGEVAEVAFSSAIRAASSASPTSGTPLSPYVLRFQVAGGKVLDGWTSQSLAGSVAEAVTVVAAELSAEGAGVEFLVLGGEELHLFTQRPPGSWTQTSMDVGTSLPLPQGSPRAVGAVVYDLDEDGTPEIVVLLTGAQGSRLETYGAGAAGNLVLEGDPVDFPAASAAGILAVDLDANGRQEILVTHPAVSGSGSGSTFVSLFERVLVPPDPADIDPTDPSTALPRPGFQRQAGALPGFGESTRLVAAELNGDGKLDVVAEARSKLVLYDNLGSATVKYALRATNEIALGETASPRAWDAGDVDGDGDRDLVIWGGNELLVYLNRPGADGLLGENPPALDLSLDIGAQDPRSLLLHEVDGDGRTDIVLQEEDGLVSLYRGVGADVAFERVPLSGAEGLAGGLAALDADGDTGLDIVSVAGTEVRIAASEGVEPPESAAPSAFRLTDSRPEDDLIEVLVIGDLEERFVGYSLALDYDESVLAYEGFTPPEEFAGEADYLLCPDASLTGCQGNAAAVMSYRQSTEGLPAGGLVLGAFRFRLPVVAQRVTTRIELAAFESGGSSFENALRVKDGDAVAETAVEIEGGPITVVLEPPPPEALTAGCEVEERGDASLDGVVTWSSPAEIAFHEFEVRVGSEQTVTLPASVSEHRFTTELTGVIPVSVRGLDEAGDEVAIATCQVTGIHRPSVECSEVAGAPARQNRISWMLHVVERFALYKNGRFLATVGSSAREFTDTAPTPNAADSYEVAGVIGEEEGPRGLCGPIGDPDQSRTEPPVVTSLMLLSRPTAVEPNRLHLRWRNGEGYTGVRLSVERVDAARVVLMATLAGTQTEYTYEGDLASGGVPPGQYEFTLVGTSSGVDSAAVSSSTVDVPVPALAVDFGCVVDSAGDIVATWDPVWKGYDSLRLFVERREDGTPSGPPQEIVLSLEDTSRTVADIEPLGEYSLRLVAAYSAALPAPLVPPPGSLERRCEIDFDPEVRIGEIDGGVGITRLEMPVRATAVGRLTGFRFTLEYPDFLTIDPAAGLELDFEGGQADLQVLAGGSGRRRAQVTVSGLDLSADSDGDGVADPERTLATLVASVPADFGLAERSPLAFVGTTALTFAEFGETVVDARDGTLLIHRRFVFITPLEGEGPAEIAAGSGEEAVMAFRATFNAPAPDYQLIGFNMHLRWDPDEIELLPLSDADRRLSAVHGQGLLFLPDAPRVADAAELGELSVPWFATSAESLLEPASDIILFVLRFRARLPATAPTTLSTIEFLRGPGVQNPTLFFPNFDAHVPDLQGFLEGGIRIVSQGSPLTLDGVVPAEGSLHGGHEVTLEGSGLLPAGGGSAGMTLELVLGAQTLPVRDILAASPASIRFRVPDSGRRSPSPASFVADLRFVSPAGSAVLEDAYTYVAPRLDGTDRPSGRASGGELLVIRGAGLPPSSAVAFRVPGVASPFPATVVSVSADARNVRVLTPLLRGHEGARATIEVTVPGIVVTPLTGVYEVLPDGGGSVLRLIGLDDTRGLICGGETVALTGEGFLPSLRVHFGDFEGAVKVTSSTTASVTTPAVPEGTTVVSVRATNGTGPEAVLPGGYTFEHPAGPFIRGDVDGSGSVTLTDAVVLSDLVFGRSISFPENLDAADANDDGTLDGGDVNVILGVLFLEIPEFPDPFPEAGLDPTPDTLTSCP
jgi:hypothetical protein